MNGDKIDWDATTEVDFFDEHRYLKWLCQKFQLTLKNINEKTTLISKNGNIIYYKNSNGLEEWKEFDWLGVMHQLCMELKPKE